MSVGTDLHHLQHVAKHDAEECGSVLRRALDRMNRLHESALRQSAQVACEVKGEGDR